MLYELTGSMFTVNHSEYRGSCTSGHFIWPSASFINFIWNAHECKILFIIWSFQMGFYRLQNDHYFKKKRTVDMNVVNDVTSTRQSLITRVVIRFSWHDWIIATSCDKAFWMLLSLIKNVMVNHFVLNHSECYYYSLWNGKPFWN